MQEIKGITTINHNIRVKLRLSLHEYTLLYFLSEWRILNKNNPSVQDYWVNLGVKSDDETIQKILSGLVIKGFLDINHIVTEKWNSEFRFVASPELDKDLKTVNKAKNSRSKSVSIKKQFIPPTQKECSDYFFENGYDPNKGIEFWRFYNAGNWTDSNGKQIVNWKQKCITVWFKPNNLLPEKTDNDIKKLVM